MKINTLTGTRRILMALCLAPLSAHALNAGQWEISGKSCRTLSDDGRTLVATGTDRSFILFSLSEDCRQYRLQDKNRVISLLLNGQAMTAKAVCHDASGRWMMVPDSKAGMESAISQLQQNTEIRLSTSDGEVNTTVKRGNYAQVCPVVNGSAAPDNRLTEQDVQRTEPGEAITGKNRLSLGELMNMNK